jgi:hypothetical protein
MSQAPETNSQDAEMLSLAPALVDQMPGQYFIVFSDEKKI